MNKKPKQEILPQRLKEPGRESNVRERTEVALKESEKEYRTIIEEIEDGYYEIDIAGNFTLVNNAACKLLGRTMNELIGMNNREYMDKTTAKKVYKTFNKVYTTGSPDKGYNYEIKRKDGTKRIIDASVSLKLNSEGIPIGFRGIMRDITSRKRAEEQLAKHRSLLEAIFRSVKDAIITVDTEMRVIQANKATERVCFLPVEKIAGKVFADCLTQCSGSCLEVLKETLASKNTISEYRIECNAQKQPRQIVVVTTSQLLDQDGKFIGAVLVIKDLTRLVGLERELRERHQFQTIIGKSKKMQEIYSLLEDLADLETTVLITGESGTGKELVAKAIHYSGRRGFKPFVTVNCSALAENLLESELFGHIKGAFTGAIRDKQGRFQAADGGTIMFDEISDISPRIQLKLLRVLQEKEFERVGESIPRKVDVRVMVCTNRDLREKVRVGEFREDLYYRLNIIEIKLPPLRERAEDIPLLVNHMCNRFNKDFKKNIVGISDAVLEAFMNYPWPGNIRELEHTIERAFVLCHGQLITLNNIPTEIRGYSGIKTSAFNEKALIGPQEILDVLNKAGWSKAKAARLLKISRPTLYRKIDQFKLIKPPNYV